MFKEILDTHAEVKPLICIYKIRVLKVLANERDKKIVEMFDICLEIEVNVV